MLIIYSLVFYRLSSGWNLIKEIDLDGENNIRFSIIVPFRNEKKNLNRLIDSLTLIKYNKDNYEIIFVNDNSEDDGREIVSNSLQYQLNWKLIDSVGFGKKNAITYGIDCSINEYILTIDADCVVPPKILDAYCSKLNTKRYDMLSGPVQFIHNSQICSFLNYELIGLVGIGASTIELGNPTMANGANLCFKKNKFIEVNGYNDNIEIASGDDEFLLKKISKLKNSNISFLKSNYAIVETLAPSTFKQFINQRKRWSSKWKFNSIKDNIAPIFIFFFYILQILLLINIEFIEVILLLIAFKIFFELYFMQSVLKFFKKFKLLIIGILIQFIYPFYIMLIGFISLLNTRYTWKNRNVK